MKKQIVCLVLSIPCSAFAQDPPPADTTPVSPPPSPSPPPVTASAPAPAPDHVRFRFDAKLGGGLLGLTGLVPQAVAGIAYGRLSVGLGLGFLRGSFGASTSGSPGAEASGTLITFAPTGVFDFVRTSDEKVSVYGLLSLSPSILVVNNGSNGPCSSSATGVFGYQLAAGMRYAVHPQFSVGAEVGPSGQLAWFGPGNCGGMTGGTTNSVGVHGLYSALVGTFFTN